MRLSLIAVLAVFLTSAAEATPGLFKINDGCVLKKYQNKAWEPTDATILNGITVDPLPPKSGSVRMKIKGEWYSTTESCLSAASEADSAPSDTASAPNEKETQPSTAPASHSTFYLRGVIGGLYNLSDTNSSIQMAFGGGIGIHIGQFAGGSLSLGGLFTTSSQSTATGLITVTSTFSEILFVPLLHGLGGSGLYLGPEVGFGTRTSSSGAGVSLSGSSIDIGANLGYEIKLSDAVTLGPDLHFTRIGQTTISNVTAEAQNLLKFMVSMAVHF